MPGGEEEHVVLARKYRPKTLAELVGQDVFVKTISNAISINKLHHAFLLTGTRGVGKTSSARILALSLNCEKYNGPTLTPCLTCDCCSAILSGSNPDVVEFDAASNTGKDDIHLNVIDKVNFSTIMSRYKVYIIDEVHMLSKSAFNALLKTLEEPPDKVKFIFATTEVNKVPITILSRCQKFFLKNVDEETMLEHLQNICKKENVMYEPMALKMIAKYANGSVRDGLSLLDQAITIGNNNITDIDIKNMLSIPDRQMIAKLFYSSYLGDVAEAIKDAECFISSDVDVNKVVSELMEMILDSLKIANCLTTFDRLPHEFIDVLKKLVDDDNLNVPRLLRMWQVISSSLSEMTAINSRAYLTALIYKICYISTLPTPIEVIKMLKDDTLKKAVEDFPDGKILK